MKIYQLIIFTTLIIYTLNTCFKSTDIHKYKDCTTRVIDAVEKLMGIKYCCYLYGVSGNSETKRCEGLTQAQYEDVEETKKWFEKLYEVKVKNITCA